MTQHSTFSQANHPTPIVPTTGPKALAGLQVNLGITSPQAPNVDTPESADHQIQDERPIMNLTPRASDEKLDTDMMAIHLVKHAQPNRGLAIHSSYAPQHLTISIAQPNYDILYVSHTEPSVLPITLFPSAMRFAPGRKVAVEGFISYATKVGRIRVIDQTSGARMLLRRHEGQVLDMAIGRPDPRRWRCIASVATDGRLVVWKLPVRFDEETARYEVLAEVVAEAHRFTALRWHPKEPSVLLVATDDAKLVLLRLERGTFGAMWKRGTPLGRTLSDTEAFEGQEAIQTSCKVRFRQLFPAPRK